MVKRSHVDKTIVLLHIGDRYVPIVETGIEVIKDNDEGKSAEIEGAGNTGHSENCEDSGAEDETKLEDAPVKSPKMTDKKND